METLDWTHKNANFTDIRKLNDFYIFTINHIDKPLIVKRKILEERLKQYFLTNNLESISRKDILEMDWNLYITKGYYIKIDEMGEAEKFHQDEEKFYVSFLEPAGPLGTFNKKSK